MYVGKKPLEITVRTADHSHLYTNGIIPPKSPSTPTTDTTDEITDRVSFDKIHTFRRTPDPYRRDSRDNNEEDAEDSEPMTEVRQHNRDRSAKLLSESKVVRDYGTQSEEKSTRNIGTMSEPVKTRNASNEVQPQSSGTQTADLLQKNGTDLGQPTSQRAQYDSRTNEYYSSQRSPPPVHRNKYASSTAIIPRQNDYIDYDQHEVPHLSQYNDDPRDQHITTRNDYQRSTNHKPHSSSQTRQHLPSSTNPHRTPPPPVEYCSRLSNERYRTPSPSDHPYHHFIKPQRSRSPSPPIQKHIQTSTSRERTVSPPSQHRSRQLERSPSPPSTRHHISSSSIKLNRTPSPPVQYRSTSPDDRHRSPPLPPKNYPRKTKDRPQMTSAETDTSLDGMKPQQHRGIQPEPPSTREYGITTNIDRKHPTQTSHLINPNTISSTYPQYQTLNSPLPKRPDHIITSPYQDDYKSVRNDQPSLTKKNYPLRTDREDSYINNYEEIPSKYDESISPEYTRNIDRSKEYTSKSFTGGDRHQRRSPTVEPRSYEEEQHATIVFTDDVHNEDFIRELPTGGSVSIPSTTVIQPDTLPRSYGQIKSPIHQKHDRVDNRKKITELPLQHAYQRTTSIRDTPVLNIGTQNILYQAPDNEFTIPFETRYVHEFDGNEFTRNNNSIRSSTLKRDDLRSKNNRILLLPVINSSRTYVFEKQLLPEQNIRQSRTNGNFYLATSPTLHSLNSSFQNDDSEFDPLTKNIDSTNSSGRGLRSQVA